MRLPALASVCGLMLMLVPALARSAESQPPPARSPGPVTDPLPSRADEGAADTDDEPMPPGSAADQKLWRATGDVSHRVQLQRIAANKLQWEFRAMRPDERVLAAAKAAPPEEAKRLEDLHKRLVAAWVRNYQFLVDRWPVDPTRGCLYQRLFLASTMRGSEGPYKEPQVAQARDEARRCVEVATAAVEVMEGSTRELRAVLAEADRSLPVAPPPGPGVPAARAKE